MGTVFRRSSPPVRRLKAELRTAAWRRQQDTGSPGRPPAGRVCSPAFRWSSPPIHSLTPQTVSATSESDPRPRAPTCLCVAAYGQARGRGSSRLRVVFFSPDAADAERPGRRPRAGARGRAREALAPHCSRKRLACGVSTTSGPRVATVGALTQREPLRRKGRGGQRNRGGFNSHPCASAVSRCAVRNARYFLPGPFVASGLSPTFFLSFCASFLGSGGFFSRSLSCLATSSTLVLAMRKTCFLPPATA